MGGTGMIKNKYKISNHYLCSIQPMRCRSFFLIQAGEALCAKDTVIPMHFQAFGCASDVAPEHDFLRGVSYVTHKNSYAPNIEKGETKIVFMTRKECL